nr:MAG TPA: upper collar protein [Caudoviricetes sp.]
MGRRKQDRQFWESSYMNSAVFKQYYNRLLELSISMFEWKNLPESVDPRFIELTLFSDGQAVFFKDEVLDFLCLQCAANGNFDVYRVPMRRRAYAVNGYQRNLDMNDSVIIYNNYLRTGSRLDVEVFARRLWNLDRAIDVNANAQKTPVLINCDETNRLTMKQMYMEYDGNQPFIFGSKGLDTKGITVLKTDAPYVADKLFTLKTQIWNEALTYLGISNINIQKKERLITDEVTRNQGGTIASRYGRLEARREACRKINEMFDLDIWVDYREDYQKVEDGKDTTEGDDEQEVSEVE